MANLPEWPSQVGVLPSEGLREQAYFWRILERMFELDPNRLQATIRECKHGNPAKLHKLLQLYATELGLS